MTTRRRSQLPPLARAIATAIETDIPLGLILSCDKVYNKVAPAGSPFPYAVLAFATETADNDFNAPGTDARQRIDLWDDGAIERGDTRLMDAWDALYGLLHEQPLTVEGFDVVIGTLDLVTTLADPDGEHTHAVTEYRIISRQQ